MTTLSIKTKIGFVVLGAVVGAGKIASYLSPLNLSVWQHLNLIPGLADRGLHTPTTSHHLLFLWRELLWLGCCRSESGCRSCCKILARHYNAIPCCTVLYKTKQCYSMLYNAIRCYTMLYHDIPCYTVLCNTLSCCIILGMSMRQNLLKFSNAIHILFSFRGLIWVKRRCDLLIIKDSVRPPMAFGTSLPSSGKWSNGICVQGRLPEKCYNYCV